MGAGQMHQLAVKAKNRRNRRAKQTPRAAHDRLKHRRNIRCRVADHLQHFTDCSLIFKRFGQLGGALVDLALQPSIGFTQLPGHLIELFREAF